jgi:glycosyltransferase involved in cell wall biosynthesis
VGRNRAGGRHVIFVPKKTLLHLTPLAAIGGCETDCLRIVEGLGDYNHHVLVFDDPGPMSAKWDALSARVDHLSNWQSTGPRNFRRAFSRWVQSQPRPAGIFYWSTSRLPIVINVLRAWDVPLCVHLGNPIPTGITAKIRRWVQECIHPSPSNVTLVGCSNHAAASHRQAAYFRRFSTKVIYNPVTTAFDQAHDYRELPIGSGPRIGMVARLDTIKDHRTLIRALATIASVRPSLTVEFAGDGPMRPALQDEARKLGMTDRVRFLGFTNVVPLLKEWDIYVHSTTPAEGMGTSVAEAMMAGLPCVVSDLGVMREVCGEDGAIYFPVGDAAALGQDLIQLIEDRARRETLGLAAQKRARTMFAVAEVSQSYLQVVFPELAKELT